MSGLKVTCPCECSLWKHIYQGWGDCPVFKGISGGSVDVYDPVCKGCPYGVHVNEVDES